MPLSALPGNATFVFSLYDAPGATGKLLGGGTATAAVLAGSPFTVAVTLDGVVNSVTVTLSNSFVAGSSGSASVVVAAKDPDGNTIIAPGNYTSPITLTNSDTTGTYKLSATTVNGPTDVITLTYNGGAVTTPATIAPSANGIPATALTPATAVTLNYFPSSVSYTYKSTNTSSSTYINTPSPAPSSSPAPASTPYTYSSTYATTVSSPATFNGLANLFDERQTYTIGTTNQTTYAADSYYGLISNNSAKAYTLVGGTSVLSSASPGGTVSSTGLSHRNFAVASLPFVDGASTTPDQTSDNTTTTIFSPVPTASGTPSSSTTSTYVSTTDRAGNYKATSTNTYGMTVETERADGSGSFFQSSGTQGMPTYSSATVNVGAPSGGSIAVSITTVSNGGSPTTNTYSLPVTSVYPNGTPQKTLAETVVVSTKNVSLPAECAVPATIVASPLIALTDTSTSWFPSFGEVTSYTNTLYLTPSLGRICAIGDMNYTSLINAYGLLYSESTPTVNDLLAYGSIGKNHFVSYVTGLSTGSTARLPRATVTSYSGPLDPLASELAPFGRHHAGLNRHFAPEMNR